MLAIAIILFAVNCAVGIAAQLRRLRLGWLHHALYAVVFGSAALAAWTDFRPALLGVLAVLAIFPWIRAGTPMHAGLAVVGALGYIAAWVG